MDPGGTFSIAKLDMTIIFSPHFRNPSDRCPQIVFTVALQSIYGMVVQTLLVGVVFAKLTRPKHRAQTLIFSKNAVIAQRDGRLCFMFRIGDMRKSNLSSGNLTVMMIRKHVTTEGEVLPYYLHEMPVSACKTTNVSRF